MGTLSNLIEAHKFKIQLKEAVDPKVHITEFVQLKNDQGMLFFVYLRIKPSEYIEFKAKVGRGEMINPNQYEILEYGWGEPTEALQQIMLEKHGVDHEYENKVRAVLEKNSKKLEEAS